ncbi:MAG: glutathione S-transferase family protein [Caulobacteraceae bacterium]
MPLKLYAHPFSSYCQKALIALYENATRFQLMLLDGGEPVATEFARLWPIKRFPLLTDGDRVVPEASVIIEYLALHHPGPVTLIPADAGAAIEARMLDRFFDNYVMTPQGKIVANALREPGERDARGVADARAMLDTAYAVLDRWMAGREWAAAGAFSLADCAAAPALFYADWTHPIVETFGNVRAYRRRLLARPSFARAVDEARPYRPLFPLGAPDQD